MIKLNSSLLSSFSKIKDFAINILASVLLTGMTQIVVYPLLGKWLTTVEYGTILTLIGVVNAIGSSIGGPLNNTKILLNTAYEEKGLTGDYNIVAAFCAAATFIITFIVSTAIRGSLSFEAILLSIVASLVFFRAYYSSAYRIQINFKKVFLCNLCGVIGYGVGILIVFWTKQWYWAFLFGELFSCIYVFFTSFIIREPFKRTRLLGRLLVRFGCYFISNFLSYAITYMDRFFLYPVLGAESVSIYTTASLLGKIAGIVMTPITGVLLSYYCKEATISVKQFTKRISIFFAFSIFAYAVIAFLGYPILEILYPNLAPLSRPYFYIANLSAIILLLGDAIMPTLLRYANPYWTPIIQGIFAFSYVLFGFIGMKFNSLMGYCVAAVIVTTIRLLILLSVSFITILKINKKENINLKK